MARAKAEGHRVVLVVATRGELGERRRGIVAPARRSRERRVAETQAAAASSASTGSSSSATPTPAWPASPPTTRRDRSRAPTSKRPRSASPHLARRARRRAHRVRRQRRLRPPRPYPGPPGRRPRGRDRGHPARVRGDDEPRPLQRLMASGRRRSADVDESSMPTAEDSTDLGVAEALITTTVDVREYATRSAPRWPRTRARSARTRSSSRCPTKRSARRSATSGSSAAARPGTPRRRLF